VCYMNSLSTKHFMPPVQVMHWRQCFHHVPLLILLSRCLSSANKDLPAGQAGRWVHYTNTTADDASVFWLSCFFCVLYRFDEGYIIYLVRVLFWRNHPSPVIENVWAMMIVWRMTGKIIGTVPSCIVNDSCAQSYAGTWPLSSCCR